MSRPPHHSPQAADAQKRVVRIGLVQSICTPSQTDNCAQALAGIAAAAQQGAEVVCLQELFAGEYPCQSEDQTKFAQAQSVPGPLTDLLAVAAKQYGVVILGSVFERRTPGLFHNTAVVFEADGSLVGTYRKMHIP
ncbi:MAG: acyltransferase, partial [Planctomycetota bacterium]